MRALELEEITHLSSRPGVQTLVVENWLMTVDKNKDEIAALLNLRADVTRNKGWNGATIKAIREGIALACR